MSDKWSMTKADRDALVAQVTEAREAGASARYLGALATVAVLEAGAIGTGRLYATQGDYAKALGTTNGNVSALGNLGRAIRLGIGQDHASYAVVSRRAGNIGQAVKDPKATVTKVVAAAKAADKKATDAEKAKAAEKAAAKAAKAESRTVAATTPEETTVEDDSPLARATAALAILRECEPSLTAAEWTAIRNGLVGLTAEGDKRSAAKRAA